MIVCPLFPILAIQAGWITAEVGRQPYVVYPATSSPEGVQLLTNNGVSASVSSVELLITIVLFIAVYAIISGGQHRRPGRCRRHRGRFRSDGCSIRRVRFQEGGELTWRSWVSSGSASFSC